MTVDRDEVVDDCDDHDDDNDEGVDDDNINYRFYFLTICPHGL